MKRGDRVLDLGAAPGGWLQAAHQVVGGQGFILGVDKEEIVPFQYYNVATIKADVTQDSIINQISSCTHSEFDVFISDLSPDLSGVWELDQARQIALAQSALMIARSLLKPSGNMLVKVFQGSDVRGFQLEMKSSFRILRIVKPPASRPESAEVYFLGMGFLG